MLLQMQRLLRTAGVFLVLASSVASFIVAGWSDFAAREKRPATVYFFVRAGGSPCWCERRQAFCVSDLGGTGARPIRWPGEFHGRRQVARR